MSRLDDYRRALLAAHPEMAADELLRVVDEEGDDFVGLVTDYGLGPLWHEQTGHAGFHQSRMQAEALYSGQEGALLEVGDALEDTGVDHVIIKGAANRLLLYGNPAVRACYDIDVLVKQEDRVRAAESLVKIGFTPRPMKEVMGRELELTRRDADVDLHWGLLREGRLRNDMTEPMLERRRQSHGVWMLSANDALFALLVHPAFRKHLAGYGMGLHRVADLLEWLRRGEYDWPFVRELLAENGVKAAAWATLRWVELLSDPHAPRILRKMLADLQPGRVRRSWIDYWLRHNLPEATSGARWTRLLGFSLFLHDSIGDGIRAAAARFGAGRKGREDLAAFSDLVG